MFIYQSIYRCRSGFFETDIKPFGLCSIIDNESHPARDKGLKLSVLFLFPYPPPLIFQYSLSSFLFIRSLSQAYFNSPVSLFLSYLLPLSLFLTLLPLFPCLLFYYFSLYFSFSFAYSLSLSLSLSLSIFSWHPTLILLLPVSPFYSLSPRLSIYFLFSFFFFFF